MFYDLTKHRDVGLELSKRSRNIYNRFPYAHCTQESALNKYAMIQIHPTKIYDLCVQFKHFWLDRRIGSAFPTSSQGTLATHKYVSTPAEELMPYEHRVRSRLLPKSMSACDVVVAFETVDVIDATDILFL